MEKYVYFRTEATLTDDDDQTSSCLFPLSSFAGAYVVSTTLLCLTFEGMHEYKGGANRAHDNILITTSTNESRTVLRAILNEFSTGENIFIVIGDDESGTTEYLDSNISNVMAITIDLSDAD